jgi:2,3-diaminopropionate biosynthesis protein SbnA
MIVDSVLDCIGNTPLVRLGSMFPEYRDVEVLAKLEALNPGGSVKDRVARAILAQGVESSLIAADTHLVESSSGNFGISVAMIACKLGMPFTCVVDARTTRANIGILRAFGASVDIVDRPLGTQGFLGARLRRVNELVEAIPGALWVNQYASQNNWRAHYSNTADEILQDLSHIDAIFVPVSTTGTITGIARRLREQCPDIRVVAVDAYGSTIFPDAPTGSRQLPGMGSCLPSQFLAAGEIDEIVWITDQEAAAAAQALARREGILAGGSAGATIAAIQRLLPEFSEGARLVGILPDRGERYLDTVYDERWYQSGQTTVNGENGVAATDSTVSNERRGGGGERRDLRELVMRHRRRFAWYDTLVEGDGVSLAELPIVDEALLLKHYYNAHHGQFPDAHAYQTSGTSTGRRKTILYSPADHASYCAQRAELFADFLSDVAPGSVAVSDVGTGHAAASARTIFRQIGLEPREIDYRRPIVEHVTVLNDSQPAVLFTMPVILDRLLACEDGLDIRPRKVIVVGDVAPANWRRHIAQAFGIELEDVLDIVGSIEVGAIAYHSNATGLYHFHDHLHPEVIEPQAVFPDCSRGLSGDQKLLLLTSFAREYLPVVRYATNDIVRGFRRMHWQGKDICVCDRFDGRFGGEVKHGERVSNHDLCAAVNDAFPGCQFDVVENGGLEIRIATERVTPEQEAVVANFLMNASPDVGDMVRAGLVRPIAVTAIDPDELTVRGGKRNFSTRSH